MALERRTLFENQQSTVAAIKQVADYLLTIPLESDDKEGSESVVQPVIMVITGLSGIGKSELTAELKRLYQLHSSSHDDQVTVFLINSVPLMVIQDTIVASSFTMTEQGLRLSLVIDSAELYGLHTEFRDVLNRVDNTDVIRVTQRTLSYQEADGFIERLQLSSNWGEDLNIFNELTLGVPKLIQSGIKRKNLDEVAEDTTWYLAQHLRSFTDPDTLRQAVQLIETNFLAEGRRIPAEVLKKLPTMLGLLNVEGAYGILLHRYQSERDPKIYQALQAMHPETREYYGQNNLGGQGNTSFYLEAWIDTSDVDFDELERVLEDHRPDFSRPEFGKLGELLALFKLSPSIVGFESRASVGGGATKSQFGFQITQGERSVSITNNPYQSLFPERSRDSSNALSNNAFARAAQQMQKDAPNFIIEVHDHDVSGPAYAAGALEAVLQSLGIRYEVTHPDRATFGYDPLDSTYKEQFSTQELEAKKREAHKQRTGKDKKKKR